jgi:hypothetical protein
MPAAGSGDATSEASSNAANAGSRPTIRYWAYSVRLAARALGSLK